MMVPNRVNEVATLCAAHPEAFIEGEGHDATRLQFLLGIVIPALVALDGPDWGYLTKTDQRLPDDSYKIPCDILMWRPSRETVDCLTQSGACWIEHTAPPAAWEWTAVPRAPRPDVVLTISPVVYRPETLRLSEGIVVPVGDGVSVALQHADGLYVSVQPDGRVEDRTEIGPWERATRVGATLLRYAETGTDYYIVVQAR